MITDELLDRISELAQLEIADDEREAVKADLESVIDMVEKLKRLDTDGVEPLGLPFDIGRDALREDEQIDIGRDALREDELTEKSDKKASGEGVAETANDAESSADCIETIDFGTGLIDGAPQTDGEYIIVPDSINRDDSSTNVESGNTKQGQTPIQAHAEQNISLQPDTKDDENIFISKNYNSSSGKLRIAVKDNICVKGLPATAGSRILKSFIPPYSSTAIELLESAGMQIVGKTNMDEFGMGSTGETSYFGPVKNPYDQTRVAGGSSSGAAAAVATGGADAALGTDTGGSIRQPCAFCGLTGIKPTYGTVSRYGLIAYASSFDQIGPIAKDIKTCAQILDLISGVDEKDSTTVHRSAPELTQAIDDLSRDIFDDTDGAKEQKNVKNAPLQGVRIGIVENLPKDRTHPDILNAMEKTCDSLTGLGAKKVDISLDYLEYAVSAYYIIACAEASSNLERYDGVRYGHRAHKYTSLKDMYKKSRTEGFGKQTRLRILLGTFVLSSGYYDEYYLRALKVKRLIAQEFDRAYEKCDMILMPVTTGYAPKLGETLKDPVEMYQNDIYTVPANLCGLPAVAFPVKSDKPYSKEHLPIGMQVMGAGFSEDKLVRAVYAYEQLAK
ncbi:MAG: Asp-tRNA(Asn)/Glu-tRNA(Gln) amidotransferase subunit GatA [Eubacterium sp.]|nr:Asp-tRNA(Asn)/Glu-tRNA(Gln) amidotransferase subunit GatA [Eubacterium sp.]